jgi:RNA polymerase sigma-70 factor (ECF subfamily)
LGIDEAMEDELLVQQVLRGRIEAFEALVKRHERALFAYLGRMGLQQAETEDLAQEAFLRAFRHLHRFDVKLARFSTWLFTIARRLALNSLNRHERRYTHPTTELTQQLTSEPQIVQDQLHRHLHEALLQLPLKYRSPLALAYLKELSIAEIAALEGCAPGTVKSRIHRAKQQLRKHLANHLGELDDE